MCVPFDPTLFWLSSHYLEEQSLIECIKVELESGH